MVNVSRLPAPLAASWDWQINAACREIDNTVFFHPTNERGEAKETRDNRAKTICLHCPVADACLRHALAAREPYGVWGGLTTAERSAILLGLPTSGRIPERAKTAEHTAPGHRAVVTWSAPS